MSDDLLENERWEPVLAQDEDEYEEISSEEVDRVVASLEDLMMAVESENIRHLLEAAAQEIHCLVYEADDEDEYYAEAA